MVNGIAQPVQQAIDVAAGDLAQTTFQSGSGADRLWVRAFDGLDWSAWVSFTVTAPVNHVPIVDAPNINAGKGQSLAASSLFAVTEIDQGDTITKYRFWDSTAAPNSGHFVVDGTVQGVDVAIEVTAAQLAQTTFQTGSGTDMLWVRAFDGWEWGAWKSFTVTAPVNHAATVAASDIMAAKDQSFAAASLFSANDPDQGDTISAYQFWDSTTRSDSGHFVVDGITQAANQAIDVAANQLAQTTFQSGFGTDQLWVRAFDGLEWGAWTSFTVTAPTNHAPDVAGLDRSMAPNEDVAAAALFTAIDHDQDSIVQYQFWDSTNDATSGHFAIDGNAQNAREAIDVLAADLDHASFVAGSAPGGDSLWVRATDGSLWSDWAAFHVQTHA